MIKIAIVDDEKVVLERVKSCIEGVTEIAGKVETDMFQGAELFLKRVEQGHIYDIVFSDIQMTGMDGIQFGTIIREKYPRMYLIFLTSYSSYAVDSYLIDAYQYILKAQMAERIPPVLFRLTEKIERERKKYRIVSSVNDIKKIYHNEIVYIKKIKGSKYVEYVMLNDTCRERISLDRLLHELDDEAFLMIERGYIVNMRYVVRMHGTTIYLQNNEQVVVSRARFMEVQERMNGRIGK
ncbi:LytR/AlgR family response regulator transcription factor [Frisingicoccus sp.]|uniref:LytR/AlgR family response regulator transcription factor n=1 Tax=Frisingicoccus sp. TaxID=1918627 RepID=UPI003AB3CE6D